MRPTPIPAPGAATSEADSLYGRGICELRAGRKSRGRADIEAATALSYAVADEFAYYGVRP